MGRQFHSLGHLREKQDCPKDVLNFGTIMSPLTEAWAKLVEEKGFSEDGFKFVKN